MLYLVKTINYKGRKEDNADTGDLKNYFTCVLLSTSYEWAAPK
jgi:hypothetical protein